MIPFERRRPPRAAFVFFVPHPFFYCPPQVFPLNVSPKPSSEPSVHRFCECFSEHFPVLSRVPLSLSRHLSPPLVPTTCSHYLSPSPSLLFIPSLLPRGGRCSLQAYSVPELLLSFSTSGWIESHPEVECVWEWVESTEYHLFCGHSTCGCRGLLSPSVFPFRRTSMRRSSIRPTFAVFRAL